MESVQAVIRQLLEGQQDESLLQSLQDDLSLRHKRMLASDSVVYQREINLKLYEEMSQLLTQLQQIMDDYVLEPILSDCIEHVFFTEHEQTVRHTFVALPLREELTRQIVPDNSNSSSTDEIAITVHLCYQDS